MTIRHDSRRIRSRAGIRTTRRLPPCCRHPDEPISGICASCLRERLSGLDASSIDIVSAPKLRRCRSVVSTSQCEASSSGLNRKSCDVSSLSDLFDVDDLEIGSDSEVKVESKNVGLSKVADTVIKSKRENQDESRVLRDESGQLNRDCVDNDREFEDVETKPMKEYIDLEFRNRSKKSKDLRDIAGNIWGAASVFSKKLRKWRQKNSKVKENKSSSKSDLVGNVGNLHLVQNARKLEETHSETMGRRSCDVEPRFSVDGRRISFEEPRASWDGYMIARSIPRLAPMFSVVENGILGNVGRFENHRSSLDGPMHSIIEDESSSGASASGPSNSDSSSSMRRSSFDRSSSVRGFGKKLISSEDQGVSLANMKLVITEKELKDWHLTSRRDEELESKSSLNVPTKKSIGWKKVCNVFVFKHKNCENTCEGKTIMYSPSIGETQGKLARSSSVVGSRNLCDETRLDYRRKSVDNAGLFTFNGREEFKLEKNRSCTNSAADLENGVMTPLRSLRNNRSGKFKLQSPYSMAGNLLRLN